MKFIVPVSCASVLALTSFNAVAQDTSQPEVSLPSVTVVVKEKPPQKKAQARKADKVKKKSSVAKAAPAPLSEPQTAESTGDAQQPETALGPVQGLVATRTGTGSKTDTPIVEVPRTVNVVTEDQITEQQPQSVREALGYTPGVQNQTGAASILDTISVRGFPAPIFLDGLPLPTDTGIGFAKIKSPTSSARSSL